MKISERNRNNKTLRSGATVVEMAVVVAIFLFLLFGIVEYCRFIYVRQVMVNAAREGARFAVVNTLVAEMESSTKDRVNEYLDSIRNSVKITKLEVYQGDKDGNYKGPPGDALFGEYVVVEIEGEFETILPSFLHMQETFTIQTKALMYSEAN